MGNDIYEKTNQAAYPPEVLERVNVFVRFIEQFVDDSPIADVCCGNGELGELLGAKYFYDFYPPNPKIMKCDLLNYGNKVTTKTSNIVMAHALEHFEDPVTTLKILSEEFLEPGGKIFLAVPHGKFNNNHKPFDRSIGHLIAFAPKDLKAIAEEAGFKVEMVVENFMFEDYEEIFAILRKT